MALTHASLLRKLNYDPITGVLVWLVSPRRSVKAGDVAGYWAGVQSDRRRRIMIGTASYTAARLAWFYMTGAWPTGVIDHKDRNPENDVFSNYRDVPQAVNNQNRSLPSTNKSGHIGVSQYRGRRWHSQITLNKKKRHLGFFVELKDAVSARATAQEALFQPV